MTRRPHHPKTCQRIDLMGELGFMHVQHAPGFIQTEYEVWAPAISYMYDALECLKEQVGAVQSSISEGRRQSLAVPVTALEYMLERRDLLMAKGIYKDNPGVAAAVGLALDGPSSTALVSSRVQEIVGQAHTMQLQQMVKAQAKVRAEPKGSAPKQKE